MGDFWLPRLWLECFQRSVRTHPCQNSKNPTDRESWTSIVPAGVGSRASSPEPAGGHAARGSTTSMLRRYMPGRASSSSIRSLLSRGGAVGPPVSRAAVRVDQPTPAPSATPIMASRVTRSASSSSPSESVPGRTAAPSRSVVSASTGRTATPGEGLPQASTRRTAAPSRSVVSASTGRTATPSRSSGRPARSEVDQHVFQKSPFPLRP